MQEDADIVERRDLITVFQKFDEKSLEIAVPDRIDRPVAELRSDMPVIEVNVADERKIL